MKFKLVALDIDGTLLNDEGIIPEKNKEILTYFVKNGGNVVLSSGRMTDCVSSVAGLLNIDCFLISYNGAMVRGKKSEGRNLVFHKPLASKYGDMLISYCMKQKFHLNYYLKDVLYSQKNTNFKKYADLYSNQTGAKFVFLDDINTLKGNCPTKLILITDFHHSDTLRTRNYQYDRFSEKLDGEINILKTNPEYLEFFNKNVNKGVALDKLAQFYGFERDEIIAFGDGDNDLEMLQFAGLGVAMSNASESVKKSADIVLDWDNNAAGVEKFLSPLIPTFSHQGRRKQYKSPAKRYK